MHKPGKSRGHGWRLRSRSALLVAGGAFVASACAELAGLNDLGDAESASIESGGERGFEDEDDGSEASGGNSLGGAPEPRQTGGSNPMEEAGGGDPCAETECAGEQLCDGKECAFSCEAGDARCGPDAREVCEEGRWVVEACPDNRVCVEQGECLAPPFVASFSSDTPIASPGQSVLLQWSITAQGPIEVSIEPDIGDAPAVTDGSLVFQPRQSARYTLTATNAAGSNSRGTTLKMIPGGKLDRVHTIGATSIPLAMSISSSGRLATLHRAKSTYTVGTVTADLDDYYVLEHDITAGTVERMAIPEQVREGHDLLFDGEELIVTGSSVPVGESSQDTIVVERLNAYLQHSDYVDYRVSPEWPETGDKLALGPDGSIYVLAYSGVVANTVAQLDSNLDVLDGVIGELGIVWLDLVVGDSGFTHLLRYGLQGEVDFLEEVRADAAVQSMNWTALDDAQGTTLIRFPQGGFMVVGHGLGQGYLHALNPVNIGPHATYFVYPDELSEAPFDSLEFVDACLSETDQVLALGRITREGQTDILVQSFSYSNNRISLDWSEPFIWGTEETNVLATSIACDHKGYAYVLGARRDVDLTGSHGWEPFIVRVR